MARHRTIQICGLNIAMHQPHDPESYMLLFRRAQSSQHRFKQGELHVLMLGSWSPATIEDSNAGLLSGYIYRFVRIDPREPWFNIETNQPATDQEMGEINIPERLMAHLQTIPFVFNSRSHRLWYIAKDKDSSLGPKNAEKFFESILTKTAAQNRMPPVEVTAIPAEDSLDAIFQMHQLTRLVIDLKRPNPDDAASISRVFLEQLATQNVQRQMTVMTASHGQSILPNEATKTLAEVAALNGDVRGEGRDALGLPLTEATSERPLKRAERVNALVENALDVLKRVASSLI